MPKHLTKEQLESYRKEGAVSPVPLLSREEAAYYRRKFDELEEATGDEAQSRYRIKAHLPFPWLTELIHHPKLLDAIEDVMGPNLLVWGTSFFTKAAHDPRFISWHQDSTYYGLEPPESVTAWIAFSDSTEESGCMRFIPGSHLGPHILPHVETKAPNNLLSRGQTIENIDESVAKSLPARAGEFSIHHNKTIHSSEPNMSDDARIGFTVHFATPEIRQAQFEGATATLVRGKDDSGNWGPDPVAKEDFDPACLAALDEAWVRYRTAMRAQA
jgi:hypothetical protein